MRLEKKKNISDKEIAYGRLTGFFFKMVLCRIS